jgi:hypothetical protein
MEPYAGVDYNLALCPLQSRLQNIYHGQPCQSRLYPPVSDFESSLWWLEQLWLSFPCGGSESILVKFKISRVLNKTGIKIRVLQQMVYGMDPTWPANGINQSLIWNCTQSVTVVFLFVPRNQKINFLVCFSLFRSFEQPIQTYLFLNKPKQTQIFFQPYTYRYSVGWTRVVRHVQVHHKFLVL